MPLNRDPARANIRTMHASFVIMFLLMFIIFILGIYETLAAIVNPNASILLPLVDERARSAQLAAAAPAENPWLTVQAPTQVYSPGMEPIRMAQPGERYQVTTHEGNWALAVRQGESPDRAVWIALDSNVKAPGLVPDTLEEGMIAVALIAAAMLLTLVIYYGIRRRLRRGRDGRGRRRRGVAANAARPVTNGSGQLPTAS